MAGRLTAVTVRPFSSGDAEAADRVNRLAFGRFFGLEDPLSFRGDSMVVRERFSTNPDGAFVAELEGELVGCGFVSNWGSVGLLGPLTVDPAYWNRGIGRLLMTPLVDHMERSGFTLQGLFTHPQSPSHVRLYEAFGFRMDRITGVMDKSVLPTAEPRGDYDRLSESTEIERAVVIGECRKVTHAVYPGFDLEGEIRQIISHGKGDVLLIRDGRELAGFACCHHGAGSEGGSDQVLVKVGLVCGTDADERFKRLLRACEDYARLCGVNRLVAGTNAGRRGAYRMMLEAGFRTWMNGVAMFRTPGVGYNRPDAYVIDDWR